MSGNGPIVELMSGFPDFKTPGFDINSYNQRFKEKNYVISAKASKIHYDKHWGCLSLKFTLNGDEHYRTSNSTYTVNQSNFLILNLDTEYSSEIASATNVESFTLNFSEDFSNALFASLTSKTEDVLENNLQKKTNYPPFIERLYSRDALIYPLVSKIYHRLENFYPLNDEVAELFAELFSAMLIHQESVNLEIGAIGKIRYSTKLELYRRLNYARDFMDSCYGERINLEAIARVACLNREYFIRQFKDYFKVTPTQYLIRKRMEAARRLLLTRDRSVAEVCQQVGYYDTSSFTKLFRRHFRHHPTDQIK